MSQPARILAAPLSVPRWLLLVGLLVAGVSAAETHRFNVLFIAVDDLRPELGCYGMDYVQSPDIDRLAGQGTVFSRHYVQVPSCGASRYAMLSGRSPDPVEDLAEQQPDLVRKMLALLPTP